MLLIDLFCKAGGASWGYYEAGFDVVGIDIEPQPHYPFTFIHMDAIEFLADFPEWARLATLIHASPPCKDHTKLKALTGREYVSLIAPTREGLDATGIPYVIENVPGSPLIDPVILCGSMFGLGVRRHRHFELKHWKMQQPECRHAEQNAASPMYPTKRYHSGKPVIHMSPVVGVFGRGQGLGPGEIDLWRQAMGIPWMTKDELAQAIPPAYTRFLGEQFSTQ